MFKILLLIIILFWTISVLKHEGMASLGSFYKKENMYRILESTKEGYTNAYFFGTSKRKYFAVPEDNAIGLDSNGQLSEFPDRWLVQTVSKNNGELQAYIKSGSNGFWLGLTDNGDIELSPNSTKTLWKMVPASVLNKHVYNMMAHNAWLAKTDRNKLYLSSNNKNLLVKFIDLMQ